MRRCELPIRQLLIGDRARRAPGATARSARFHACPLPAVVTGSSISSPVIGQRYCGGTGAGATGSPATADAPPTDELLSPARASASACRVNERCRFVSASDFRSSCTSSSISDALSRRTCALSRSGTIVGPPVAGRVDVQVGAAVAGGVEEHGGGRGRTRSSGGRNHGVTSIGIPSTTFALDVAGCCGRSGHGDLDGRRLGGRAGCRLLALAVDDERDERREGRRYPRRSAERSRRASAAAAAAAARSSGRCTSHLRSRRCSCPLHCRRRRCSRRRI